METPGRLWPVRAPIQQIADSNIIGIKFGKRDGTIVDANDEFLRMVGYTREDLDAGRLNWIKMTPPEWGVAARLAARQIDDIGKVAPFEQEYFRKDGTRVPVLIGIVATPEPEADGLCFVMDLTERKESEKDLDRLMVERFAMLDSVGDGIFGLDMEGRCTFINPAGVRMLGYGAEECRGQNMHVLVHSKRADGSPYPAEDCPAAQALRRCVELRVDEEVLWRKEGTAFPVEYSSYPIVLNGRNEGSVVCFKDISERKRAEEKLRASEARFRGAFACAAAGMCITDLEGRLLEVNQALCHFTGYSERELLAANAGSLGHPDDLHTSDGQIGELLRKEIPGFVTEKRYIRKDGSIATARCSVAALLDAAGNPDRFVTIAEDITEQVEAKLELRRTEERYRCIVENTQEGVSKCDTARGMTHANPLLKAVPGGAGDADLQCEYFEEDSADAERRFELRKKNLSEWYESGLQQGDGTPLRVNSSAGSLGMSTDVSARQELEVQMLHAQMEAVGQLASGIAHDFNNLVTLILGYSAELEQKLAAEDPRLKNVVEIKKAGERAAAVNRELLAFSHKQVSRPCVIALNQLIRGMEGMLGSLLGDGVELATDLDPGAGNIEADPGQIEQVILNLAINALDATPQGGLIAIESHREDFEDGTAPPGSLPAGSYAVVTLTDSGGGMDEQTRARISEPFFTTKEEGVGTGVGLSAVLRIVNQSGGAISVSSEIDRGTTFKVYLPLVEALPDDAPS